MRKGLSITANALYEILFTKLKSNNKKTGDFIIYTQEDIMKELEISKPTAIKYLKELEDRKYIYQEKLGRGNPNKIYCLKIIEKNPYYILDDNKL